MKNIRTILLSALVAVFAWGTFTQCTSAVEEPLTLAIPFKCNAYVTPLDPASKVTPSFADKIIANGYDLPNDAEMIPGAWLPKYQQQEPHQISVFFYTAYTGDLHIGLRAANVPTGVSELKVKCGGKSFDLKVSDTDADKDYYVGKVNVSKPGHVRVDIEPIKTTAASYPTFSALLAAGEAVNNLTEKRKGEVVFVDTDELKDHVPHFVRRGPSNHFNWHTPDNVEYFYNEAYVPEGQDIPGAYYMLTGGSGFYMGIQPIEKGKGRMVLFSVWDTDTEKGLISELVRNGEGVKSNAYSHEGSGVQNFYPYDWETGRTYATLVRVRPEYGWVPLSVQFPSQWMCDKDGNWFEVLKGKFTCDGTGRQELRRDYAGGVTEDGHFYLRNIGYVDEHVEYGTEFERKGNGKKPEIDFKALIKLSQSTDDRSKF